MSTIKSGQILLYCRFSKIIKEPGTRFQSPAFCQKHVSNVCHTDTARKTIFSFSKCSEKMAFSKKLHWNMIFLILSGKMIFLFPENIILFFRRKIKDDISQKNTRKYDIFFKCSEKMVFQKKSHQNMIFLIVLFGKMIFLFPENMILSFRQKMKDDVSQKNIRKYDISFKCPEKIVFAKKKSYLNVIFLVLSGKMVFFSGKYDIFPLDRK